MPLVFSYGTLQQEDVQRSTFGRLLQGQRDDLLGFEPSLVRIEDPQVVATSGKTFCGTRPFLRCQGKILLPMQDSTGHHGDSLCRLSPEAAPGGISHAPS